MLSGAFGAIPCAIGEVSDRAGFGSGNMGLPYRPGHPQAQRWLRKPEVGTHIARKAHGCGDLGSELP